MSSTTFGAGKNRYLIRASDPQHLAAFIDRISLVPDIELIDVIGPVGQPHTAVVALSHDQAALLEQQFRTVNPQLTIEPDRPLSLFGAM